MSAKAEAEVSGTLVAALEAELATQKVKLATLRRRFVDPQAPEVRQVQDQVQEIQKQVQLERAALVVLLAEICRRSSTISSARR